MCGVYTHSVGVDDVTGDTLIQKSAQCEDTVFLSRSSLTHTQRPVHSTTRSLISRPLMPPFTQKQQCFQIPKYRSLHLPPPSSNSRTNFVHSQQHFLIPSIQNSKSPHAPQNSNLSISCHIFHNTSPSSTAKTHYYYSVYFPPHSTVLYHLYASISPLLLPSPKKPSVHNSHQGLQSMKKLS
jgi:hypothetical protein